MDPIFTVPIATPILTGQPMGNNYVLIPGIFSTLEDENDYLSSLDSDTRDYVIKHSNEFSSRAELIDCVNKLHGDV